MSALITACQLMLKWCYRLILNSYHKEFSMPLFSIMHNSEHFEASFQGSTESSCSSPSWRHQRRPGKKNSEGDFKRHHVGNFTGQCKLP